MTESWHVETSAMDEYQQDCLRTWDNRGLNQQRKLHAAIGIAGEAGEILELLKKHIFHSWPAPQKDEMKKELGDVLYYVAVLAAENRLTLQEVADANIAKLRERYPDGYSHEASQARRDGGAIADVPVWKLAGVHDGYVFEDGDEA